MHNNTQSGADLYSVGTQHGNLHQLSVTTSRVTYFILQAHTGTGVSHSQYRANSGEVLEKMQVNGAAQPSYKYYKVIISKQVLDLHKIKQCCEQQQTSINPSWAVRFVFETYEVS